MNSKKNVILNLFQDLKNKLKKHYLIILILIFGIVLRFYRFEEFITFLGDQGRDAIIIKRILTFEHLPAIGAPTSIGQVYLGPFYYYFIAPWLLFFNFNPIGLAFGVAFFSVFYILINYLIIKELIDKKTAILSSIFITFSYVLIELSRFSWNPNLLPLFTLLSVYFLIKSIKTQKWHFFALTGSFLSFSLQLHYVFLFSMPIIFLIYFINLIKKIKNFKKTIINYSLLIINFLFFSSPLMIFDLRHNFLNTNNFIKLFSQSGSTLQNKINNFFDSFYYLNSYSFNLDINRFFIYGLIISLFLSVIFLIQQKSNIKYFLIIFITSLSFMAFFSGPRHPHYFGSLYPLYFVIIAYFLSYSLDSIFSKIILLFFITGFIFLNFQKYPYFKYKGDNQINLSKKVALKIKENVKKEKFTITSLPEKYSDSTYRYFLEILNKKPIEKDSLEKAEELFVVCEKKCEVIIGNPQWDIAYFAPNKIIGEWQVNNVKIYKLIR